MAYRDQNEALRAKVESLETDLAQTRSERDAERQRAERLLATHERLRAFEQEQAEAIASRGRHTAKTIAIGISMVIALIAVATRLSPAARSYEPPPLEVLQTPPVTPADRARFDELAHQARVTGGRWQVLGLWSGTITSARGETHLRSGDACRVQLGSRAEAYTLVVTCGDTPVFVGDEGLFLTCDPPSGGVPSRCSSQRPLRVDARFDERTVVVRDGDRSISIRLTTSMLVAP